MIPDGWLQTRVGDIGQVITGCTPSTSVAAYYGGFFRLISPADLDESKYIRTAHKNLSDKGFLQCRKLPKDTVLVGCIGNIGKLGMTPDNLCASNQQINALVCGKEYDPHFIYYSFYFNRSRLQASAVKTTLPILNKTNFEKFTILTPKLDEQRRIAAVLSFAQGAIEHQERLIQLTRELKKALMHKLFTEGMGSENQKMTEIGLVPQSWKQVELQKTGDVIYGIQAAVANNLEALGTKILTNKNITLEGRIVLDEINYFELKTRRHFEAILRKGDILFNWRSGSKEHIGKTALFDLDGEYTHSSFILRIRPNSDVCNRFLFYYLFYLRTSKYFLQKHDMSSVNATFNKSAVNVLPVLLPLEDEQQEIARILDKVELKIELLMQKRRVLKELFHTLLHQLMTDQIRVNDLDLADLGIQSQGKQKQQEVI